MSKTSENRLFLPAFLRIKTAPAPRSNSSAKTEKLKNMKQNREFRKQLTSYGKGSNSEQYKKPAFTMTGSRKLNVHMERNQAL